MQDSIYQGDVGLEILVDCQEDIAGAVAPALAVRTPSGAVRLWPATVAVIGQTASHLRYITGPGDLGEAGTYRVQASLELGDWSGSGRTAQFVVRPRFS